MKKVTKIVHKSEAGKVHVFEAADFETGVEKTKYDAVMAAATTLQKAAVAQSQVATTKSAKTPGKVAPKPKGVFQNLLALQQTLTTAMQNLTNHLQALGCKYLNAGCFAAGTPLWTPGGYRAIETLGRVDVSSHKAMSIIGLRCDPPECVQTHLSLCVDGS